MHVVPCCVAERAAEAALQARFTWALGALLWVIEMRYYLWNQDTISTCRHGCNTMAQAYFYM